MKVTDKNKSPYAVDTDTLYSRLSSDRPTYAGTYDQQMKDLYSKITTRPDFVYDVTKDPLFQHYKGQYIQQGQRAMKDTMGQAAALTGGYGSTYAQGVGQQAYNAYLERLGDIVPALYDRAYGRWNDDNDRLLKQYAMLGDLQQTEYGRFRDELADWENEREWQSKLESEEYARARDALADERYDDELARLAEETAYNRQWNEELRDYNRERDAISDQRYADELAYSRAWNEDARNYAREQDAYNRRWNEELRDYNRERDAISDQRYADELAYAREQDAYNRQWNQDERAYNREQNSYSNLLSMISRTGYNPTDAELAAANMTRAQADALRKTWMGTDPTLAYMAGALSADEYYMLTGMLPPGVVPAGGGAVGGGGGNAVAPYGNYPNAAGLSTTQIKEIQEALKHNPELRAQGYSVDVDGVWGPQTEAAFNAAVGGGQTTTTATTSAAANEKKKAGGGGGRMLAATR